MPSVNGEPENAQPRNVNAEHSALVVARASTALMVTVSLAGSLVTARLRSTETTTARGTGRGQHLLACFTRDPAASHRKNPSRTTRTCSRRCLNSPINRGRPAGAARADTAGPVRCLPAANPRCSTVPSPRARARGQDTELRCADERR